MTGNSGPAEEVENPLIAYPQMRNTGDTELAHGNPPQKQQLGGHFVGWSMVNGIELLFQETADGTKTRGAHCMNCFYYLRQDVMLTKAWKLCQRSLEGAPYLGCRAR